MKKMINKVDMWIVKAVVAMIAAEWTYREFYELDEIAPWVILLGLGISTIVDIVGWFKTNFKRKEG